MRITRSGSILLTLVIVTISAPLLLSLDASLGEIKVLAQEVDARKAQADSLEKLANQQYQTSQFEAALQSWQQALSIYREIKDPLGEGKSLCGIGAAYDSLRDFPKAINYHQQCLTIAIRIKERKLEGRVLANLGLAYYNLGDYPKAIEYYQQSLKIVLAIKDSLAEGRILSNFGSVYRNLGEYAKAIDYYQQSLTIANKIGDLKGEGRVLGNLGLVYFLLSDYPKAIDHQQLRLKIALVIKDLQGQGQALGDLGVIYYSLGDYPKAIDYYKQALKIALDIKDRQGEAQSLGNLGIVYDSLRDYPKAIDFHQQSLKVSLIIKDRQGEAQSLVNLGMSYNNSGNYAKAINYQQQALTILRELKNRNGEGKALGNLSNVYYRLGEYSKAIDYEQQSLKIAREIKNPQAEATSLNNIGLALYRQGNLRSAESTLFEAIKVQESLRGRLKDSEKVSITDTQRGTYLTLQQVLVAQNKTGAALEIAERSRARAFVELLASRISPDTQRILTSPTIAEIKQTAKAQNTTLVQYSITYDDFKVQDKQETKESQIYIWVVKPTGEVTFRKADLKPLWQKDNTDLYQLVTTVRNNIGARGTPYRGIQVSHNPDTTNTQNNLRRLHKILIDPIADLLPKNENDKVVFIPQGSLFLVPFPALQDASGKYLIEKHTILTSPSIQVLDLTRKQREAQKTPLQDVLIVGNPTMPSVAPKIGAQPQQLAPLPGAEKEAKAIGNLLNTKPLIGNEATKAAVLERLPRARFIHLATHGIFDDVQGINSSIALAPSSNNSGDGLLTAGEILDLKLNAELVVLSACDTGRGKITGDGVIGLSRALISAGAPSVLVSLWSVPDAPTSLLMTEFYKNLQKNPDKAQALRQAMLTTMKKNPNPVDWAAFTLIGEAE
ncbi:TPR repeat-containing protein [Calothrix sp. PCC 7716]|nr:TPR repeat-containing protein [Calothrix sp. PCC 7716]